MIYVEKNLPWWFSCDYDKTIVAFIRSIHDMFRLVKKIDLDKEKDRESYEKHHEKDWL